jgi:hypothetical protein
LGGQNSAALIGVEHGGKIYVDGKIYASGKIYVDGKIWSATYDERKHSAEV